MPYLIEMVGVSIIVAFRIVFIFICLQTIINRSYGSFKSIIIKKQDEKFFISLSNISAVTLPQLLSRWLSKCDTWNIRKRNNKYFEFFALFCSKKIHSFGLLSFVIKLYSHTNIFQIFVWNNLGKEECSKGGHF